MRFPVPEPGEPVRVSATTFVSYRRCPASAVARLQGHYPPESRSSFVGALAHRLFARHLRSGPISPDQVESACREEIGVGLNPKLGALGIKPSELRRVVAEVGGLYERFCRFPLEGFAGDEVALAVAPAPGVELVGKVDAVFAGPEGPRLVDWKTGSLGDTGDQLGFYALLWALSRGEVPALVEAVSVKTGERYSATPTAGGLQQVAGEVSAMVSELRRAFGSEPELRAGPWCRWCPILDGCPEGAAAVSVLDGEAGGVTPPRDA